MMLTLGELRIVIAESFKRARRGSSSCEAYDHSLIDDDSFLSHSSYVADDVKERIVAWLVTMGLTDRRC